MTRSDIILTPKELTPEILADLESRGLVKTLQPPQSIEKDPSCDGVETMYSSEAEFGTHKLICVRKNQTEIKLTTHPENEEVIFLNNTGRSFKPLYLIIGKEREEVLEEKGRSGDLSEEDFLALEVDFNDPATCVFSVLKGATHCEVTKEGDGEAPIFYVTEPTDMTMKYSDFSGFNFRLKE